MNLVCLFTSLLVPHSPNPLMYHTAGDDYTALTTDLTFVGGNLENCMMINTTFDIDPVNEDEMFTVTLATSEPTTAVNLSSSTATVTIQNSTSSKVH